MGTFDFFAFLIIVAYIPFNYHYHLFIPFGWWILDGFRLKWIVDGCNQVQSKTSERNNQLIDSYELWFPFGILGLHRFYLADYWMGFGYLFTLGYFGIGWLLDGFRMFWLVQLAREPKTDTENKNISMAYLLSVPFAGFVGLHHYYLKRYLFGCIYSFTFGLLGFGPLVDLFRMKKYVNNANDPSIIIGQPETKPKKELIEAYQLYFPLGWLGLHHIYLQNYLHAFAYFLSFGVAGIGFILDAFRMRKTS